MFILCITYLVLVLVYDVLYSITFLLLDLIPTFTVENVLIFARIINISTILQYMHWKIALILLCMIVHTNNVQHMETMIAFVIIKK